MREAVIAAAGMCLFALFAQRSLPLFGVSLAGLLLVAALIIRSVGRETSLLAVFGWGPFSRKVGLATAVGCILGLLLGLSYRGAYDLSLIPGPLALFVVSAALIGATEELVFRGYIQGRITGSGFWLAPVFAALSHTAYKSALFVFPPAGVEIDLPLLASLTFVAGFALALLRQLSGSVLPAVAAHVLFDVLAYGDRLEAPWWVWR
ncbi:MAG: CPBP family intramembrane metalloprotease [Betaproteobacteria bacterium]|nr:CPBP family intramembrane metalloprotease [Betaproteobacteria bacterium]